MKNKAKLYCVLFCVSFLVVGCSSQPAPPGPPPADVQAPSPESDESPEVAEPPPQAKEPPAKSSAPVAEAPRPAPTEVPSTKAPVETAPAEVASPPPLPPPPPPPAAPVSQPSQPAKAEPPRPTAPSPEVPSAPVVVDIGGPVEVAAPKPGLTRIGAEKCKICHKVQYASWSETAHAARTPPLDCEGCHGPGSEYKGLSVMKDPVKAREAGLVDPDRAFCSQCHKSGWTDDQFARAHAHKVESD